MRGNQLPVSAARWQHGYQICFANFIGQTAKNPTTTKAKEKISTDLESLEFKKFFDAYLAKCNNHSNFT